MTLHEPTHAGKSTAPAIQHALHALVLAAGRGRRFGGAKLLATYRDRPLLAYPLAVVAAACRQGMLRSGHVVIGTSDDKSRQMVEEVNLRPILNDAPDLGLSHSLRIGLKALQQYNEEVAGAMIFLGDQPLIRPSVVQSLVSAWQPRPTVIIRPVYESNPAVPSHPVILPRRVWSHIAELKGDIGFGSLPGHKKEAFLVHVSGDNPDVDTIPDLDALEKSAG